MISISQEDGLRWVTLDRMQSLNAFDENQWLELLDVLTAAESDDHVRCICLRGAGGNFSSGYDLRAALKELDKATADTLRKHITRGNQVCWKVWNYKKPVIAAIEGYCLGGAFELAMACDFVLVDETARLGEPEVRVAATAPFLISPWVLAMRHAKEILLTGDTVTAARAERMGIVNEVCKAGDIEPCVRGWAKKLSGFDASLWSANKRAVNRNYELMGFSAAIAMGEDAFVEHYLMPSPFKEEFADRLDKNGFSATMRWVQGRHE